jgi:spermidine/putrescine transport system substrate-binding protein
LKVYNATNYIDKSTIADFEKEFNLKVVYGEFESNEEMYEKISADPKAYDVLIPSDYTIDRLIKEGKLSKIDPAKVGNIANIAPQYLKPEYDPDNDYVVPYMVGTLGILYNKKQVSAPIDSWEALFDSKYKGKILMWDSMRDVIGAALKTLGYSVNANDSGELAEVKAKLGAQRSIIQAYAGDEIRDIMIADEGVLAIVYSGDAKTAIDENPKLAYVIPKEGSNKWVDGFVIMKNTTRLDAAEKFINFMCRPNIAVRNMTKTGYTSPVAGSWSEFGGNRIMFPTDEELNRCEAFLYNADANAKYTKLWQEIRGVR